MAQVETDIDIDIANRDAALAGLPHIPAMVRDKVGRTSRHASGVYFQPVPVNPLTGLCAYDYTEAADHGYFKIDLLNKPLYQGVRDMAHLDRLLATEPPWELLDDRDSFAQLSLEHIHERFGLVQTIRPRSIEDLAVVIALQRPGKSHLVGRPRAQIDADIWVPTKAYYFKKPHAVAYAALIVVQMNLAIERLMQGDEADQGQADGPLA